MKNHLKIQVTKNKINETLDSLIGFLESEKDSLNQRGKEVQRELLLLKTNYHKYETDSRLNLVDNEKLQITRNNIIYRLLELIDELDLPIEKNIDFDSYIFCLYCIFEISKFENISLIQEQVKKAFQDNANNIIIYEKDGLTIKFKSFRAALATGKKLALFIKFFDYYKFGFECQPKSKLTITDNDLPLNFRKIAPKEYIELWTKNSVAEGVNEQIVKSEEGFGKIKIEDLNEFLLSDVQFEKRQKLLRQFAFIWLISDQLPIGSWGKSVTSWMDAVWREMPNYSPNQDMEIEGGFETSILNINLLFNVINPKDFFDSKIWNRFKGYLKNRFDKEAGGFGTKSSRRAGYYINHSVRHTSLAINFLIELSKSEYFTTNDFDSFIYRGIRYLFFDNNELTIEGRSKIEVIKADKRNPAMQFCLFWQIYEKLNNNEHIKGLFKKDELKLIKEIWENSQRKILNKVLEEEYDGNENAEKRSIPKLITPYGKFIRMETYTFLSTAMLIDGSMPIRIRNRYRMGIGKLIEDYLHRHNKENRYSPDPLRTHKRGIKSHFSENLATNLDLGCTAMLFRVLRSEDILEAIFGEQFPTWLDEVRFYLEEDLVQQFDRFLIAPELFEETNAGMLANLLFNDKRAILDKLIKPYLNQLDTLHKEKVSEMDVENFILDNLVKNNVGEIDTQIGIISLIYLLLKKRPKRYLEEKMGMDELNYIYWEKLDKTDLNHEITTFLTSKAYNYGIDAFINSHNGINKDPKNYQLSETRKYYINLLIDNLKSRIETKNQSKKTILDAACGTGDYSIELANRGFEVVGVDISNKMIQRAQSVYKNKNLTRNANFIVNDIKNLPLNWHNYFEGIICITAFQHIQSLYLEQVLSEFNRVLKPKGVLRIDFQLGRIRGFDPDLRFIEGYKDLKDIHSKINFKSHGFTVVNSNTWTLKKGRNSFKRPVPFDFVEMWLKKE